MSVTLADRKTLNGLSKRAAMTLIELLVVIAIIALLAVVSIGALMAVPEHARVRGTEALIAKIDSKLAQRLNQFNSRRDTIRTLASCDLILSNNEPSLGRIIAIFRTMRQEFPETFDASNYNAPATDGIDNDDDGATDELDELISADWYPVNLTGSAVPSQSQRELSAAALGHLAYMQRVIMDSTLRPNQVPFRSLHEIHRETTRAECLYMIVTADGTDTSEFAPNEIKDTDEDGLPEFVDKWGNPIQFFLWPSYYTSPRQKPGEETNPDDPNQLLTEGSTTGWWTAQPALRLRFEALFFSLTHMTTTTRPQGYRMSPLIVSAGPDGGFGLMTAGPGPDGIMGTMDDMGTVDKRAIRITNTAIEGFGMDRDNIDNHSLRVR